MLFNSFHYVLFFLIVLLVVDAVRRRDAQHLLLLLSSYYFYFVSSGLFVLLLLYSSSLDFYVGRRIYESDSPRERKILLWLTLAGNLGLLGYFKYTNFAIGSAEALLLKLGWTPQIPELQIFLPIGISFYTFQTLSYSLDIYFGKLRPTGSFLRFALYVGFFPQLVAGPIVRARDFLPQLADKVRVRPENLRPGFTLILWGLIKKVCVADNLSSFVGDTFNGPYVEDTLVVWAAIIAFAVEIYCDFSGYTDIAIGSARVLGLRFLDNFNYPYFSRNITEFWRRWHISLSSWLRDYLYIPLGGNRRGKPRQALNFIITMVLGGLWHGAAWNFLFWGAYQGALLVAHRFLVADRKFMQSRAWDPLKILFTFWLTCVGWAIFILSDPVLLVFYCRKLMFLDFTTQGWQPIWEQYALQIFLIVAFAVVHLISYRSGRLSQVVGNLRVPAWAGASAVGVAVLYLFGAGQHKSFIYFQF